MLVQTIQLRGAALFWTNTTADDFLNPSSWSPNTIPGPADTTVFTNNLSYRVNWTANATVSQARFNAGSGTVTQAIGGSIWVITNSYVIGEAANAAAGVVHLNGTLVVTNALRNALLEVRRGTNRLDSGLVESDRLLVTNSAGRLTFNGGTLITRSATITNTSTFTMGPNPGFAPATWVIRSNFTPTIIRRLNIGVGTSSNTLIMTNGSRLVGEFGFIGLNAGGSNNLAIVAGPNTLWTNSDSFYVGSSAPYNTLLVTNGGKIAAGYAFLGSLADANHNLAEVVGSGSLWTNDTSLSLGHNGSFNSLVIANGGIVAADVSSIGVNFGANSNRVIVTGLSSLWTNRSGLRVGSQGSFNSLVITNGGVVASSVGYIGSSGGSNNAVVVTGPNSLWTNRITLLVCDAEGPGNSLLISDGGTVFNGDAGMGYGLGDSNLVKVTGLAARWISRGSVIIGMSSSGNSVLITNGGFVLASNVFVGFNSIGSNNLLSIADGILTATNTGGTGGLDVRYGATLFNGGSITIDRLLLTNGVSSLFTFNQGTLHLRSAAAANGLPFLVGDGVGSATYRMTGSTTNTHAFGDGLIISSNATLSGNGTVSGPVSVAVGGILAPGTTIGRTTLGSSPFLAGTTVMEIARAGAALTNDVLAVDGSLTYGGMLVVSNSGPDALVVGSRFILFPASAYAGSFTSLALPPLGSSLAWNNRLLVDGSLEIVDRSPLLIEGLMQSGTNFIFYVRSGPLGEHFEVLTTTNATLPLSSWITNSSGVFDWFGNVTLTNVINFAEPGRFYRVSVR